MFLLLIDMLASILLLWVPGHLAIPYQASIFRQCHLWMDSIPQRRQAGTQRRLWTKESRSTRSIHDMNLGKGTLVYSVRTFPFHALVATHPRVCSRIELAISRKLVGNTISVEVRLPLLTSHRLTTAPNAKKKRDSSFSAIVAVQNALTSCGSTLSDDSHRPLCAKMTIRFTTSRLESPPPRLPATTTFRSFRGLSLSLSRKL